MEDIKMEKSKVRKSLLHKFLEFSFKIPIPECLISNRSYTKEFSELTEEQQEVFTNAQELIKKLQAEDDILKFIDTKTLQKLRKYVNLGVWFKHLPDKNIELLAQINRHLDNIKSKQNELQQIKRRTEQCQ